MVYVTTRQLLSEIKAELEGIKSHMDFLERDRDFYKGKSDALEARLARREATYENICMSHIDQNVKIKRLELELDELKVRQHHVDNTKE